MGRPKGSKNKPKVKPSAIELPTQQTKEKKEDLPTDAKPKIGEVKKEKLQIPKDHIMHTFIQYALDRMHPSELAYYRARARKSECSLEYIMAKSFVTFFLIRDNSLKF